MLRKSNLRGPAYRATCMHTSTQNKAFPNTDSKHVPVKENMFLNDAFASYCCLMTSCRRRRGTRKVRARHEMMIRLLQLPSSRQKL